MSSSVFKFNTYWGVNLPQMASDRLELAGARGDAGAVPPPLPPDDPEAWYAPDVRSQTEVHPRHWGRKLRRLSQLSTSPSPITYASLCVIAR